MIQLGLVYNVETSHECLKILEHYFFNCFLEAANILTRSFKLSHFHFPDRKSVV